MKATRTDTLQQVTLVGLLVAGLVLLHRFAVPHGAVDPRALLAVGFVILVSRTVGEWVGRIGLPHISGYLATGLLLGESFASWVARVGPALPAPFDTGVITADIRVQLLPIEGLSLALIALSAGGEIRVAELREDFGVVARLLARVAVAVGGSVFLATAALLWGPGLPGLDSGLSTAARLAVAAVVAAIAVGTSPAITLAVVRDTGAVGPITRRILTTVVLSDVLVGVLFALATAALAVATGAAGASLMAVPVALGGALLLGAVLAGAFHGWMELVRAEVLLFVVGAIALGDAAVHGLRFDGPLTFIVAGFVLSNGSSHGVAVLREVRRLSAPMFVAFFTLAGAKLDLTAIGNILPMAVGLAFLRAGALAVATRASARDGLQPLLARDGWMGLVSQAGLAIGLANLVALRFPDVGPSIYALVLGVVALNEAVGPATLQSLLRAAGEIRSRAPREPTEEVYAPSSVAAPRWGVSLRSGSPALDAVAVDVEGRLLRALAEARDGPVAASAESRQNFLDALCAATEQTAGGSQALRSAVAAQLQARASAPVRWLPQDLLARLDEAADVVPEIVEAPWLGGTLDRRWEAPALLLARWSARRRARAGGARPVPVRAVVRTHLGGHGPSRVEPAVALSLALETRMVAEAAVAVRALARAWDVDDAVAAAAARTELDDLRAAVMREPGDVAGRLERALLALMTDIRGDLWRAGNPDQPAWGWRPGRQHRARTEALARLGPRLEAAWQDASHQAHEWACRLLVDRWEREAALRLGALRTAVVGSAEAVATDLGAVQGAARLAIDAVASAPDPVEALRRVAADLRAASQRTLGASTGWDDAVGDACLQDLRAAAMALPDHGWLTASARGDHTVPTPTPARRSMPRAELLGRIDAIVAPGVRNALHDLAANARRVEEALQEASTALGVAADVAAAADERDFDADALLVAPGRACLRRLEPAFSTPLAGEADRTLGAVARGVNAPPDGMVSGGTGTAVPSVERATAWVRERWAMRRRPSRDVASEVGALQPVPEAYRRLFLEVDAAPFDLAGLWPTARAELAEQWAHGAVLWVCDDDALVRAWWRAVGPSRPAPTRWRGHGPVAGVVSTVAWAHLAAGTAPVRAFRVPAVTPSALARLLTGRHQASGLELADPTEAGTGRWVAGLHSATSGSVRAAARGWVEGLGVASDGRLWFRGGPPSPPSPAGEDALILLRTMLRDGALTPSQAARATGDSVETIRSRLEGLGSSGWVEQVGDGFTVPDERRSAVVAQVAARGWS